MSIIDAIEKMTNSISENVPTPEKEYIGEDGLLHCVTCGEKVEKIVELMGIKKTVRCICSCRKKELQVQRDRDRQDDIERSRMICFQETNMRNWNFANDDKKNAKISDVMKRYADNFKEFKKDGKGLLLYGPCGTGKTYYAACIANELIDIGYDILMTNFGKLINKIQGTFDKKNEIITSLSKYQLLIIDDLGAERTSEYMQETIFNIIDARYRSGLPMIITTNLDISDIWNQDGIGHGRIYDRILERCIPVKVDGSSRRKEELKKNMSNVKNILGL